MALVYKQLFRQIIKDKIFLSLLLLLTILTSLSFFFVMGSIDGNMEALNELETLTENQQLYKNALHSNMALAYTFWLSLTGLSAVVFVMFFYRFFRANKKQIGCIKSLGFKNGSLQFFFTAFTAVLSVLGASLGLPGGYALSDILIRANERTYGVTGLQKSLGGFSLMTGLAGSTLVFSVTALLCYGFVRNKEAGSLLAGNHVQNRFPAALKIADKISRVMPAQKRLSLRMALRKPLSVLLLFVSVMSFQVCIVLGQSLNISSTKVFHAQTMGHNYGYQTQYREYQTARIQSNAMAYIDSASVITIGNHELERTVTGLYGINELYELQNKSGELLAAPDAGCVYANPEFSEVYGVKTGDILAVTIAGKQHSFSVKETAVNAQSGHVYMNGEQLAEILGIAPGAYNGAFSADKLEGGTAAGREQRIEELNRNSVSNKTSAVINQATGVFVGIILIFLALHISFQDSARDILILGMLGHRMKYIRKLLLDVYLPVLWFMYVIALAPAILLAKAIQKSLSISTNDYMPFGINIPVIIMAFVLMNLIYYGVQAVFSLRVKRMIEKEEITDIIYAE